MAKPKKPKKGAPKASEAPKAVAEAPKAAAAASQPAVAPGNLGPLLRLALQTASRALEAQKLPEAERAYRAALAVMPDQPDALHGLGVIALRARKPEAAQKLLGRALLAVRKTRAAPGAVAVALAHYGQAMRQLGQNDKAAAAYRESLKLAQNKQVQGWLTEVEKAPAKPA